MLVPQTKNISHRITREEYDAAVLLDTLKCPLYALGDRRSGCELLAAAFNDAQLTLQAMTATPSGRAELDSIASAVEEMLSI